jgi:hypothetical protein
MIPAIVLSEVTSLGVIFLFVVALVWLGARRKERQDFYLSEMVKKISASSGESAAEFLREYERTKSRRRREAMIIGGLMGSFAAVGLMIFLRGLVSLPVYRVGLIPLLPCLGLLIYALFFASRD